MASSAASAALGYQPGKLIGSGTQRDAEDHDPSVIIGVSAKWTRGSLAQLLDLLKHDDRIAAVPPEAAFDALLDEFLPFWESPKQRYYGFGAPGCPFADLQFYCRSAAQGMLRRFFVRSQC